MEIGYSIDDIKKFITNNGFLRVDTVRQKSEYAIRGGIIDIFSSYFSTRFFWGK